jgi:hypothetical protein
MNAKGISSGLASTLRSLAIGQLQMQASRSAAVEALATGIMAVDLATGGIVLGIRSAHHLWIVSLVALGLSFGLAMRIILLEGARRDGPSVVNVLEARDIIDDDTLEAFVLKRLAIDIRTDRRALARKERALPGAFTLLAFAIVVELAGTIH